MRKPDRVVLERAVVGADMVTTALRDAVVGSTNVEVLLVLPLIERAAILRRDLSALVEAQRADATGAR